MSTKVARVLVIDDEPSFLLLVERVLNQEGFQVFKAASGAEGLRILYNDRPDLVILDVSMPRMNGWQTCQRIREICDVPIIMMTGKQKGDGESQGRQVIPFHAILL